MRSLRMTRVTKIPPVRLAMITKRAASLLRRVCGSAGVTELGGDWVDLSRSEQAVEKV